MWVGRGLKLRGLFFNGAKTLRDLSVFYTSPQRFIITFSIRWLISFRDFWHFSLQTFLIVIYRRRNFVYHHWRCTSIYRPLSYPFRSMVKPMFTTPHSPPPYLQYISWKWGLICSLVPFRESALLIDKQITQSYPTKKRASFLQTEDLKKIQILFLWKSYFEENKDDIIHKSEVLNRYDRRT